MTFGQPAFLQLLPEVSQPPTADCPAAPEPPAGRVPGGGKPCVSRRREESLDVNFAVFAFANSHRRKLPATYSTWCSFPAITRRSPASVDTEDGLAQRRIGADFRNPKHARIGTSGVGLFVGECPLPGWDSYGGRAPFCGLSSLPCLSLGSCSGSAPIRPLLPLYSWSPTSLHRLRHCAPAPTLIQDGPGA